MIFRIEGGKNFADNSKKKNCLLEFARQFWAIFQNFRRHAGKVVGSSPSHIESTDYENDYFHLEIYLIAGLIDYLSTVANYVEYVRIRVVTGRTESMPNETGWTKAV
jgi:hypothetical protein